MVAVMVAAVMVSAVGSVEVGSVEEGSVEVGSVEVEEVMEFYSNNPNHLCHDPNILGRPCIRFAGST